MEVSINKIFQIKTALERMSKEKGHNIAYEINFNLNVCKKHIEDWTSRLEEFKKEYYEKDEKGTPISYVINTLNGEIKTDKNGKEIRFNGKLGQNEQVVQRIDNNKIEEFSVSLEKFQKETFKVNFKEITKNDVQEKFSGIDFSNLFDFIIK